MKKIEKILVRMPNWLGDLVMATPVLTDLKNHFKDASLTAMCQKNLSNLLAKDRSVDELFSFTKPSNQFLRRQELRDIIGKIEAGHYDLGVLLTNSFSSAWWFWQGKIPQRIGYAGHFRRFLLTDVVTLKKKKEHQVTQYKRILEPLGIALSKTVPRIDLEEKEIEEARAFLSQKGAFKKKKVIGIHPGAAFGSAKCWPQDRFHSLAQRLTKELDASILFFGDASSLSLVKEITKDLPPQVLNLAGMTSIRQLACLIRCCDVFISNDSGPMHIAAALQVPLISLFGSTDETLTGPYGQEESVIRKKTSCSPCFKRVCPIDFPCMKQISVDEVFERVCQKVCEHV